MPISRNIDLALLRAFVTVARTGGISSAARELHLTQGGISQQIKRLEDFFACQLLDRNPRGVRLTERGMLLLPKAQRLLDLNDGIYTEMAGAQTGRTVRVGVPHDLAGTHFAPVLKEFSAKHPEVEVKIVSGSSFDLLQDLSNGRVDLTLSQCREQDGTGERIALEQLVWIGTCEALAGQRPLPLCFVTPTCLFRRTAFSLLEEAQIGWRVVFENATVETTLAMVHSGLALTPWLSSLVPDGFHILSPESGLPALPRFAIELKLSNDLDADALGMAQAIRHHYLSLVPPMQPISG